MRVAKEYDEIRPPEENYAAKLLLEVRLPEGKCSIVGCFPVPIRSKKVKFGTRAGSNHCNQVPPIAWDTAIRVGTYVVNIGKK